VGEPRQEFERELEIIEGKVIQLFAMVGEDLNEATRALLAGDGGVFTILLERDQEIDALYLEVEELVQREILLQAPVASDLRFLLSVLRIVPELSRSHHLVVSIAGRANHILSGAGLDETSLREKVLAKLTDVQTSKKATRPRKRKG